MGGQTAGKEDVISNKISIRCKQRKFAYMLQLAINHQKMSYDIHGENDIFSSEDDNTTGFVRNYLLEENIFSFLLT